MVIDNKNDLKDKPLVVLHPLVRDSWIAALIILIATGLAYSNSLKGPFIFDDIPVIVENTSIRNLWPLWEIFYPSPGSLGIPSRPVISFTLALNYAASGTKVWSYHALNLFVHVMAALVLFGIVRRTLFSEKLRERYGHASTRLALICALIWVLHPLNTQAVTYIIQRCESLMGLFLMLALYCAIRGWQTSTPIRWHLASVASCLVAVGAKESGAVTPFLILFYDLLFVHTRVKIALQRSKWFYMGLTLCLVLSLILISILATVNSITPMKREGISVGSINYLLTQFQVVPYYIRLAFWPNALCLDYYSWPIATIKSAFPYFLFFSVLIIGTVWAFLRRLPFAFLALWFFLNLAPASSIIPLRNVAFEHRMYLPLAGLVVLFVIGVYELRKFLLNKFVSFDLRYRFLAQKCVRLLFIVIILVLGMLTFFRNSDYRSKFTIWNDTVRKQPQNARAHTNLGSALIDQNMVEALSHMQKAIQLDPDYAEAYVNLGVLLFKVDKFQEAIIPLQKAIQLDPNYADAYANLGAVFLKLGKPGEAIAHFKKALQLKQDIADVYFNLGLAIFILGKPGEAIAHFKKALQLKPDFAKAYANLGMALLRVDKPREAITQLQKALQLNPNIANAHGNLGFALFKIGMIEEAVLCLKTAIRLNPGNVNALLLLSDALARLGKHQDAIPHLQRALELNPNNSKVEKYLKQIKAQTGQK